MTGDCTLLHVSFAYLLVPIIPVSDIPADALTAVYSGYAQLCFMFLMAIWHVHESLHRHFRSSRADHQST